MRCFYCVWLSLASTAWSLSSYSPPDLFASPKYSIQLHDWDQAVTNQTAESILRDGSDASGTGDETGQVMQRQGGNNEEETSVDTKKKAKLMRTATGQAFLCSVPLAPPSFRHVAMPKQQSSSDDDVSTSDVVTLSEEEKETLVKVKRQKLDESLKRGLELLEPMRGHCIFRSQGWFTYSFCYGKGEIRQFHAVMIPGHNHPHEDPNQDVYTLGFHVSQPQHPQSRSSSSTESEGSTLTAAGELVEFGQSLGYGMGSGGGASLSSSGSLSEILKEVTSPSNSNPTSTFQDESKRYLVQRWDGGTICDMTGKQRRAEIQFHCSTVSTDYIALIRETSICEYLIVIHTPRLCSEPMFLDGSSGLNDQGNNGEPGEVIECKPVVDDEVLTIWKEKRQIELQNEVKDEVPEPILPQLDATSKAPASENDEQGESINEKKGIKEGLLNLIKGQSDGQTKETLVYYDSDTKEFYVDPANQPAEAITETEPTDRTDDTQTQTAILQLDELSKVLRHSLEQVLKDIRGENEEIVDENAEGDDGEEVQPNSLASIIAEFQKRKQQHENGQPDNSKHQRTTKQLNPGRQHRKRPNPFPATNQQQQQQTGVKVVEQAPSVLQQAVKQGRLKQSLDAGPIGGKQSSNGGSKQHEQMSQLYKKSFSDDDSKKKDEL